MSQYRKGKLHTFQFDGDTVECRLSPLDYPDMLKLEGRGGDKETRVNSFIEAAREVTPKYVTEFTGLKDADGNALSIDVVTSQVYFATLLKSIVLKLMQISQPLVEGDDADATEAGAEGPT